MVPFFSRLCLQDSDVYTEIQITDILSNFVSTRLVAGLQPEVNNTFYVTRNKADGGTEDTKRCDLYQLTNTCTLARIITCVLSCQILLFPSVFFNNSLFLY